jgi:hypothetical protein
MRRPAESPVPQSAHRLLPDPVFVISSVRSGATLLRVQLLLNSDPQIRAPHEMHLRTLSVNLTKPLDYRKGDHGPFVSFIGDWSDNIKSKKIQKARPLPDPDDVPVVLRGINRAWGCLC